MGWLAHPPCTTTTEAAPPFVVFEGWDLRMSPERVFDLSMRDFPFSLGNAFHCREITGWLDNGVVSLRTRRMVVQSYS